MQVRVRNFARAVWSAYRDRPGRIQRCLLERTPSGFELRGTKLMLSDANAHPLVVHGSELLVRICETRGATVQMAADGLRLSIDGLRLEVHTVEELYIINEVFVNQCYNV